MLRHHALFDRLAAEFAASTLLGTPAICPLARIDEGARFVRL
jgi:hypothetical protein